MDCAALGNERDLVRLMHCATLGNECDVVKLIDCAAVGSVGILNVSKSCNCFEVSLPIFFAINFLSNCIVSSGDGIVMNRTIKTMVKIV